ncbi:MAG: histidine phosphatase family protein [Planctomycetota bacterium]|nr:MAG: histidine phosphatase family protein [Planctomycetota bacterium]
MDGHTRFFLVRHGRVADPWYDRIYGDLDVPLSLEGEEQSRRAARLFEGIMLSAVISSGLARAEYAARLIREPRGLPRRDDRRLAEIYRGEWAGFGEAEVEAARPGGWRAWQDAGGLHPPPGGETLQSVRERVVTALDELAREAGSTRVAVVAHKWVLRVAACEALALPLDRSIELDVPNCAVLVLDWPLRRGSRERPETGAENGRTMPIMHGIGVERLPAL